MRQKSFFIVNCQLPLALCSMLYALCTMPLVPTRHIHFNPFVAVGEFPGGVEGQAGDSF